MFSEFEDKNLIDPSTNLDDDDDFLFVDLDDDSGNAFMENAHDGRILDEEPEHVPAPSAFEAALADRVESILNGEDVRNTDGAIEKDPAFYDEEEVNDAGDEFYDRADVIAGSEILDDTAVMDTEAAARAAAAVRAAKLGQAFASHIADDDDLVFIDDSDEREESILYNNLFDEEPITKPADSDVIADQIEAALSDQVDALLRKNGIDPAEMESRGTSEPEQQEEAEDEPVFDEYDEDDEYDEFEESVSDDTMVIVSGNEADDAGDSFGEADTKQSEKEARKAEKDAEKQAKASEKEAKRAVKKAEKEEKKAYKEKVKAYEKMERGGAVSPKVFIIPGIIIFILAAAYFGGAYYFSKHFGFASTINGTDCSYWTIDEVENMISEQTQGYSINLLEREGKKETIHAPEVGLEYVPDGQVATILKEQNCFAWPVRCWDYFMNREKLESSETHASVKVDDAKLSETVNSLDATDKNKMVAPQNAELILDGAIYAIKPEVMGTTLKDIPAMTEDLKTAMLSTLPEYDLEAEGCYENPTVYSDDEDMNKRMNAYNELVGLSITYHVGEGTFVLDGATTSQWITWDDALVPTIDQECIKAFTKTLGQTYDTVGKTRTFTGGDGQPHEVSGGTYGWSVDEKAEIDLINQMFNEKQSQDREITWVAVADSSGPVDFGNTFLEVNLSTQHMYMVQDGNVVFENDVVTGLPNGVRNTPAGVYPLLEKARNKTLRGDRKEDGTYEYETPVAYWMRVTWTGVGFHDATWQSGFGGNRYTWAGSHGCINMSYNGAATLYDLCWVGIPVVIHY